MKKKRAVAEATEALRTAERLQQQLDELYDYLVESGLEDDDIINDSHRLLVETESVTAGLDELRDALSLVG